MLEAIVFYGLAVIVVGGAFACLIARDIVRCAVGLLATLCGVAGLFVLLAANFLAAAQLIVYAGGVLVLIIFGVMLTARSAAAAAAPWNERLGVGLTLVVLVSAILYAIFTTQPPAIDRQAGGGVATVQVLGDALLTKWLLPFELVSVLLLAVLIGAAHLARPLRGS